MRQVATLLDLASVMWELILSVGIMWIRWLSPIGGTVNC